MTEEWRDASKCNNIIEALKVAQIVSEEQATKILSLVSDAMFPTYVAQVLRCNAVYEFITYNHAILCQVVHCTSVCISASGVLCVQMGGHQAHVQMGGFPANVGKSICMLCDREHSETLSVRAWLYGKIRQDNADNYTAQLQLVFAGHCTIREKDAYSKFEV